MRAIDTVGRVGGEEFAWLLADATPAEALAAAHRLRRAIRSAPFGGGLRITASFGVCGLDAARAPETLLERADLALYWAKAEFLLRASAETTGGAFSIIEEIGPLDTPLHVHEHEDELFYVVEGEHVFRVGDEEHRAGPGAVVFAQRDGTIGPEADARASRRYGIAWL